MGTLTARSNIQVSIHLHGLDSNTLDNATCGILIWLTGRCKSGDCLDSALKVGTQKHWVFVFGKSTLLGLFGSKPSRSLGALFVKFLQLGRVDRRFWRLLQALQRCLS